MWMIGFTPVPQLLRVKMRGPEVAFLKDVRMVSEQTGLRSQ
jgi:hypothetical protein